MLPNRVGNTSNEGRLRADDDQVYAQLSRQNGDTAAVQQALWQLAAQRNGVDARIARCCDDGADRRVERQSPDDGVLTSTGANDENLHEW